MILLELQTALTHVATQMTGKWLAPPKTPSLEFLQAVPSYIEKFRDGGFNSLEVHDWAEILEDDCSTTFSVLPWLEWFLKRGKLTINSLAEAAFRHFETQHKYCGQSISIFSEFYPENLRNISKPPLLLSLKGNMDLLLDPVVAVIGSRKANYESLRASVEVGVTLANAGIAIVSGGALGCDIAVHEGMLASGANEIKPIVVFAGGLISLHPKCNERAFKEILESGGLFVSERLWFQNTFPSDFPSRNRIVSGLSATTVVMSAAPRSGSLITAQEALQQGRDVLVFAGDLNDIRMEGSKNLITDGAEMFYRAEELLEILKCNSLITPEKYFNWAGKTCQLANYLGTFETESFIN